MNCNHGDLFDMGLELGGVTTCVSLCEKFNSFCTSSGTLSPFSLASCCFSAYFKIYCCNIRDLSLIWCFLVCSLQFHYLAMILCLNSNSHIQVIKAALVDGGVYHDFFACHSLNMIIDVFDPLLNLFPHCFIAGRGSKAGSFVGDLVSYEVDGINSLTVLIACWMNIPWGYSNKWIWCLMLWVILFALPLSWL